MTAFMWSHVTFLAFLTILQCGEAAPFYKELAAKVGSLAVESEFNKRERKQNLAAPLPVHGADVLKDWAAKHDSAKTPVNAASPFVELGNYALHLRDQSRLKEAAQIHAMMHATSGASVEEEQLARSVSGGAGHAMAESGRDFLKQWALSHAVSAPKATPARVEEKLVVPEAASPQSAPQNAKAPARALETPKAKAFAHAHAMMHDLGGADAAAVGSTPSDAVPQGAMVASGDDLLASWAKDHDKGVVKAALRKEIEAPASSPTASKTLKASLESEPPALSIRDDLHSLRSSMHDLQSEGVSSRVIQEDRENLKKAASDVDASARSNHLHQAMQNMGGDIPASMLPSDDQPSQTVAGVQAGNDELSKWTSAHTSKQVKKMMVDSKAASISSADVVEPVHVDNASSQQAVSEDMAKMHASVQELHRSKVHEAMRNIGSDIPDLASSESSSTQAAETMKETGIDVLDQWSKAHKKSKEKVFMMPRPSSDMALLKSSAAVSVPAHVEANVEDKMQSSVSKWRASNVHDAMRNIGSDVPDVDLAATEASATPGQSLQAAGVDALDEWSNSHKKKAQSFNFMAPLPPVPEAPPAPIAVPSDAEPAQAHESMQVSRQRMHESAVHEAMRSIGSDVPDSALPDGNTQMAADSSKEAGASDLESWSKAHARAQVKAFTMPVAPMQEMPDIPKLAALHEDAVSHTAEDWRADAQKLHQSAVHEAMRNMGSDVSDVDMIVQAQPTKVLTAAGVDALDAWSKAHDKKQVSKFVMPVTPFSDEASSVAVPAVEAEPAVQKEDMRTTLKELKYSAVHEAMHSIGSDVSDADMQQAKATVVDDGQGLMDSWSKSHPPEVKKKQKFMVDMYPPTAAPDTDMLALAMERGYGKKAQESLDAPVNKAVSMHEALRGMVGSLGSLAAAAKTHTEEVAAPSQAAADAGADLLSQWAKHHTR